LPGLAPSAPPDRSAFEELALSYVVRFERSAPAWNDRVQPAVAPRAQVGGYIGVTGKLTAASATQLEGLKRAIAGNVSQARFDLAAITDFDDAGARLLADVVGEARRRQYPLRLQRMDNLRRALEAGLARRRRGRVARRPSCAVAGRTRSTTAPSTTP
jgi:anti-anti-sigma regulatory factor